LAQASRLEYAVDADLDDVWARMVERVYAASGVVLVADKRGIPLRSVVDTDSGACANTFITWTDTKPRVYVKTEIEVRAQFEGDGCFSDKSSTGIHEVIHALQRFDSETNDHTTHGLFRGKADDREDMLEEESVGAICVFDCPVFVPED